MWLIKVLSFSSFHEMTQHRGHILKLCRRDQGIHSDSTQHVEFFQTHETDQLATRRRQDRGMEHDSHWICHQLNIRSGFGTFPLFSSVETQPRGVTSALIHKATISRSQQTTRTDANQHPITYSLLHHTITPLGGLPPLRFSTEVDLKGSSIVIPALILGILKDGERTAYTFYSLVKHIHILYVSILYQYSYALFLSFYFMLGGVVRFMAPPYQHIVPVLSVSQSFQFT